MSRIGIVLLLLLLFPLADQAAAQDLNRPFEAGVQLVVASSGEFDTTDAGVSGRLSWNVTPLIGAEAEVGFFPEDLEARGPAFTRDRVEGLFGATVGPIVGRFRPFAKARPGFVLFRGAPRPIACILIFPPPLTCSLATGDKLFAFDVGGGVEMFPADRTFIRLDLGDRLMRYHGPVIDADGDVRSDAFFGHDLRFSVGGGLRF